MPDSPPAYIRRIDRFTTPRFQTVFTQCRCIYSRDHGYGFTERVIHHCKLTNIRNEFHGTQGPYSFLMKLGTQMTSTRLKNATVHDSSEEPCCDSRLPLGSRLSWLLETDGTLVRIVKRKFYLAGGACTRGGALSYFASQT